MREKRTLVIGILVFFLGIISILLTGCGSEEDPQAELPAGAGAGLLADAKMPEAAPGAPQAPTVVPEGTPTVTAVGYYSDWQLTKPITGTVATGKTIFIKVVFSEEMKVVVADDKTARPIFYRRIDGKQTRFSIAPLGAKGQDFVSGDAKPIQTEAMFLCRYVVQPNDRGTFQFEIGAFSTDKQGNTLNAFYTHKEKLQLGQPEATPTVTSVGYYSDWQLTKPITGTVVAGKNIFIKVVFSEAMRVVVADDKTARPIFYRRIGEKQTRFNIAPLGAKGADFVSGDAKPIQTDATFLCRYVVQPNDRGTFQFEIGAFSTDKQGNTLPAYYTHGEKLQFGQNIPTPSKPNLAPATDSGVRGDNITNRTTITVTGAVKAAPKGTQVRLYSNGSEIPGASSAISGRNRWAIRTTLHEGPHAITARTFLGTAESTDSAPLNLTIDTTPPPTTNVSAEISGNTVTVQVSGTDVANYRYAITAGESDNRSYSNPIPAHRPATVEVSDFPAGTLSLYILGEDTAGNRQAQPTIARVEKTVEIPINPPPITQPPIPTEPQEPTQPTATGRHPDEGDTTYTYTLPNGETYPGFYPSEKLMQVLNTHPSAQLPFFLEAVKMEEVMDWTSHKAWDLYIVGTHRQDDAFTSVLRSAFAQFAPGDESAISRELTRAYFNLPPDSSGRDAPPHSRYWFEVEYIRLAQQHPNDPWWELLRKFNENSKGHIVGTFNPND